MDELHRYHILAVCFEHDPSIGGGVKKVMVEAIFEAESESAARQCWIDDVGTVRPPLVTVDPVTSTGIVLCRDLGPVVERHLVESPFVPDVTVTHDGERLVEIAVDWLCSYQGQDFAPGSCDEDDRYLGDGPRLLDSWLIPLASDADSWLAARRGQDTSEAFRLVSQMRCLLGNYTLKEFT